VRTEEYKNSGTDHNRGITWNFIPRTPYAGEEVRWDNKKEILAAAMRNYKTKHPEASVYECWIKGKDFVNRQKKHEEAYRKGLSFYKYKGGTYPVEDKSRMETFVEAARAFNEKVEQKMAEDKLKETEDGKVEELVQEAV
jgi:hypothetical protein